MRAFLLPIEKLGESLEATAEFCLAISYNPGARVCSRTSSRVPANVLSRSNFDYPEAGLTVNQQDSKKLDKSVSLMVFPDGLEVVRKLHRVKGLGDHINCA